MGQESAVNEVVKVFQIFSIRYNCQETIWYTYYFDGNYWKLNNQGFQIILVFFRLRVLEQRKFNVFLKPTMFKCVRATGLIHEQRTTCIRFNLYTEMNIIYFHLLILFLPVPLGDLLLPFREWSSPISKFPMKFQFLYPHFQ